MNFSNIQPFHWGEIELSEVIMIDGVPHVTKTAIGEWLEYGDSRTSVNRIVTRNPYLQNYSVEVKLTSTDGKKYERHVFHPIGFLLIVMESGQPKAQEMKAAVAEFVWNYAQAPEMPVKERNSYIREIERVAEKLAAAKDAMLYEQHRRTLVHYCRLAGWPVPDLSLLGKNADQMQLAGV